MGSLKPEKLPKQELNDSGYIQEDSSSKDGASEKKMSLNLLDFSDDVLLNIFKYCTPIDLKALGYTCSRLGALILDRTLWRHVEARNVPTGNQRMQWWLTHALSKHTLTLRLSGYAREAKGCLGYLNGNKEKCQIHGVSEDTKASDSDQEENSEGATNFCKPGTSRDEAGSSKNSEQNGCPGPQLTLTHTTLARLKELCCNLTELALEYVVIDCNVIKINMFPKPLKVLSLRGSICYNSDKSLLNKINDHLTSLQDLDVSECEWVEPAVMLPLSKLPLRRLIMQDCTRLSEFVAYASLATRYGFKALKILDLRGSPVGDSEVSALGWLPQLEELYLAPAHARDPQPNSESDAELLPWEKDEPEYYSSKYVAEDWINDEAPSTSKDNGPRTIGFLRHVGSFELPQNCDRASQWVPVVDCPPPSGLACSVVFIKSNGVSRNSRRNAEDVNRNGEGTSKNREGTSKNGEGTSKNRERTSRNERGVVKNGEGTSRNARGIGKNGGGSSRNERDIGKNGEGSSRNERSVGKNREGTSKNGRDTCKNGEGSQSATKSEIADRAGAENRKADTAKTKKINNGVENSEPTSNNEPSCSNSSPRIDFNIQANIGNCDEGIATIEIKLRRPTTSSKRKADSSMEEDNQSETKAETQSAKADSSMDEDSKSETRSQTSSSSCSSESESDSNSSDSSSSDSSDSDSESDSSEEEPPQKENVTKNNKRESQPSRVTRSFTKSDQNSDEDLPPAKKRCTSNTKDRNNIKAPSNKPDLKPKSTADLDNNDERPSKKRKLDDSESDRREAVNYPASTSKSSQTEAESSRRTTADKSRPSTSGSPRQSARGDNSQRPPDQNQNNNDAQQPDWNNVRGPGAIIIANNPNQPQPEQNAPHNIIYVSVGRRQHAMHCSRPLTATFNFINPIPAERLEYTSLVTDSAIQRFGRADGESINYVQIGPMGFVPAPYDDPTARPNRSNLRILSATGFRHITNVSLNHLATAAPRLQLVDFAGTRVTESGVQSFRNIRPECKVRYGPLESPKEDSDRPHSR